jgi:hypothetical protein
LPRTRAFDLPVLSIVSGRTQDELATDFREHANLGVTARIFAVAGAIPISRLTNEIVDSECRRIFENTVSESERVLPDLASSLRLLLVTS